MDFRAARLYIDGLRLQQERGLATTQAFVIAVPELLYQAITIWNDYPSAQNPMMLVLFVSYLALVGVVVIGMNRWDLAMRIPGYGG